MGKRKWWILATILWMTVIFCFTQLPYFTGKSTSGAIQKVVVKEHQTVHTPSATQDEIEGVNLIIRKATHVTVFGILAFLLFKSLEIYRLSYISAWILTFLYAISDEYHQSFMPGRGPSFRDVLIDSSGALLALLLVWLVNKKRSLKYT
ncbi:MAG: VanZ family protein [Bacillus sp. (in: firmicutes)]